MEYKKTYSCMEKAIESRIQNKKTWPFREVKDISGIDDFHNEDKQEILYCFFSELYQEKKEILNERIMDKLMSGEKTIFEQFLMFASYKDCHESLVKFVWSACLPELEDIFDDVIDEFSEIKMKMSEDEEHRLFDRRERALDIKAQLESLNRATMRE